MTWAAAYLYMLSSTYPKFTLPIGVAQVSSSKILYIFLILYIYLRLDFDIFLDNAYTNVCSILQKATRCFQMYCWEKTCHKKSIYKFGVFAPNHPHLMLCFSKLLWEHKISEHFTTTKSLHNLF